MRRLLPKSRFVRRMLMLSGGTLVGQLALVATSPILTRLFAPEAFGSFAVFMSLAQMLSVVAAFRYEFAVPVARSDEEAVELIGVGNAASLVSTLIVAVCVGLGGSWLARITDVSDLMPWLWLLPLTVLFNGLALPLNYWSIRRNTFRVNTSNKVIQVVAQAASQLGLGLAGTGAPGLIVGYCVGPISQFVHFARHLTREERGRLLTVNWRTVWPLAKRHWQYPVYSAPATLLTTATQFLPAVLLAALYGPAVAGLFGLGQRVMGLPVRLLAQAASQVFLGEAPKLGDDAAVRRLFVRSTAGFTLMGLVGMAPVLFLGPWMFALVFGEAWREAGAMAAMLVPQHLSRFVVLPVSQTLNIYGRQDLHLTASALNAVGLVVAFGLAYVVDMAPTRVILLYSVGTTIAYVVYLAFAWRVVRQGGLSPAAAAPGGETVALDA